MTAERRVKIVRTGREQTLAIPPEFELPGTEALVRKDGVRLIVEPATRPSLLGVLAALRPLDEEFPPIAELQPEPIDL